MTPINPVDVNTHIAQQFNASKIKQAQDTKELGVNQHPEVQKNKEDEEKNSVAKVNESENPNIDADARRKKEEEEKKRKQKKEEEIKKKNEKFAKFKDLFDKIDKDKGSKIDIKL